MLAYGMLRSFENLAGESVVVSARHSRQRNGSVFVDGEKG